MKKVFGLLALALCFNSCDDGDLVYQDLNLGDVAPKACGSGPSSNVLYKLADNQVMIAQFQDLNSFLPNEPGENSIGITGNNKVTYRLYSDTPTVNNFCDLIQPSYPTVTEEWTAISGVIKVNTTMVKNNNTTAGFEGGEKITSLLHAIVFNPITLVSPTNTEQRETPYVFGNYTELFSNAPTLLINNTLSFCPATNTIFAVTNTTALTLAIDPSLLDTSILNTPKTGLLSQTTNVLNYNVYPGGGLTTSNYCGLTLPTPSQTWTAQDGVDGVSGMVEVITTTFGAGFMHSFYIKEATMQKGNLNYKIATSYFLGNLIVE